MTIESLPKEIELLIRSNYGLILLETIEEERAENVLKSVAYRMELTFYSWNAMIGLHQTGENDAIPNTIQLAHALSNIHRASRPGIYHFQGTDVFLEEPAAQSALTQTVRTMTTLPGALVFTGNRLNVNELVRPHCMSIPFPMPTTEEYHNLLKFTYRDIVKKQPIQLEISKEDIERLVNNLHGLTLLEAKKILTRVMIEDEKLSAEDIQAVITAKKSIVHQQGLLEYYATEESMQHIADLRNLKAWLAKRKHFIVQPEKAKTMGLNFPKGILLLGVPGTGKSLCAKAVSMEWGLPLLRMDPASLYSKYIGETEKHFRNAMDMAEKMSPVILWIDEIEKAFASGGEEDGGLSKRVLGSFLSWMQERKTSVFVVATANDVAQLPPELLRKGRFDEIFFVDLPDHNTRMAIAEIHLKRRGHDVSKFDLKELADRTEGFSGSEIEQVIVSALYTALSKKSNVNQKMLIQEAQTTRPLSVTRYEHIQWLRAWAKTRTVLAN